MTVQRWDAPDKVEAQKLRFQAGDVIFGRRRAYQKKVALAEFEGICSAHALVLRGRPHYLEPDFLPVFLSSDYFLDRAVSISVGSLSPTVNWRDLKVQEFNFPPLDEQKRIADLVWAIERHRAALTHSAAQARGALAQVTAARLGSLPTTTRLGDLTTTRSGPSFSASDVHDSPVSGSVPVMGIPNTRPDGVIDLEGVGHVTGLPHTVGRIDESSLVLIRTNGNRQRIGNVYVPPLEAHGHAVSAFQFLMQANDPADREFLFWVLSEDGMQQRMSDGASGTVGLGNLAVRWLNEQIIPWSANPSERNATVEELKNHNSALTAIRAEIDATSAVSRAVLADVFGGN
ncbi:MAG: restriction endonuclease subunit S [Actinobacteria bacterium]|nr:restriction endonuclease subunit S [Actinomycetota bacterium]